MGLKLCRPPVVGFDEIEVRRAVAVLADPDHAIAFRGLRSGREACAPGNDPDAAVKAARSLADDRNVYYVLNPVAVGHSGSTNGTHILRRRWLLLDVDPVKDAAHKDEMASEAEKAAACAIAYDLYHHLQSFGWQEPVAIDSGNGLHLLYRIDLPNDAESRELLKRVLSVLAGLCGAGGILDRKVIDAPRISALPGTMKRKGDGTPERPHRPVKLLSVPDVVEVVSREQLEAIAGQAKPEPKPAPASLPPAYTPPAGITNYAAKALSEELSKIASAAAGERNDTLNTAALKLFSLAANPDFGLSLELVEAECTAAGIANGLTPAEVRATVASARKKGETQPRPTPSKNGRAHPRTESEKTQAESGWILESDDDRLADGADADMPDIGHKLGGPAVFKVESLARIMAHEYPEPKYAIHGLLSEGLNILAGPPKLGKSMLALNFGLTVAGGGKALGDRAVAAGDVLYLSLEDQARRIKWRAGQMLRGLVGIVNEDAARRLCVVTSWRRQDRGGLSMIDAWIRSRDTPSLIIIDVWNRYCPEARGAQSAYSQDADAMALVKALADHHRVTVLIIHHTRKSAPGGGKPSDFLAEVSGTLGLSGTADGVLVMARERSNDQAQLFYTGRDIDEDELVVQFDRKTLVWKSLGTAKQHLAGRVQLAIVAHLKIRGNAGATTPEVAEAIGEGRDSVRKALGRMLDAKVVYKRGNIWRMLPEDDADPFTGVGM